MHARDEAHVRVGGPCLDGIYADAASIASGVRSDPGVKRCHEFVSFQAAIVRVTLEFE